MLSKKINELINKNKDLDSRIREKNAQLLELKNAIIPMKKEAYARMYGDLTELQRAMYSLGISDWFSFEHEKVRICMKRSSPAIEGELKLFLIGEKAAKKGVSHQLGFALPSEDDGALSEKCVSLLPPDRYTPGACGKEWAAISSLCHDWDRIYPALESCFAEAAEARLRKKCSDFEREVDAFNESNGPWISDYMKKKAC